jgi:hypothetical protein
MYKTIEPLIDNPICEAREKDGKIVSSSIRPAEGYKLHEITLDESVFDEESGIETGEVKKGFTTSYITAGADYDFEKNDREIFAVKTE